MPNTKFQKINLRDGRALAYAEYGDPKGTPIIHCHGVPSSRVEGDLIINSAIAAAVGARVIVPDRPGIGYSDPQAGRRIADWPDDVRDLASQLGLRRFAMLGSSGGAPYALACGLKMPEQVFAVGILGGVAPPDAPGVLTAFTTPMRMMLRLGRFAPLLLRGLFRLNLHAIKSGGARAGERMTEMMPEPDRTLFLRPEIQSGFMACFEEACRQGTSGAATDTSLISRPWGIDISEIKVPVLLWHGVRDRNVPVECGRYIAKTIPQCTPTFYPEDAHLSVPINHQQEILSALVAAGQPKPTTARNGC
jgi:pimeloyl-ACP methyl ester carboxylesterase